MRDVPTRAEIRDARHAAATTLYLRLVPLSVIAGRLDLPLDRIAAEMALVRQRWRDRLADPPAELDRHLDRLAEVDLEEVEAAGLMVQAIALDNPHVDAEAVLSGDWKPVVGPAGRIAQRAFERALTRRARLLGFVWGDPRAN
jgi:hypothetical protein